MTADKTTMAAIVLGGALGAAFALAGGNRAVPPAARRTRAAVIQASAVAPATDATVQATVGAPAASVPRPATAAPASAAIDSLAPEAKDSASSRSATDLALECARRDALACLAAADAFEAGRGVSADSGKARLHRVLAVSLLNEQCTARKAQACADLATLYGSGTGVEKNAATSAALRDRALRLCEGKADADCERLRSGLLR